MQSSDQRFLCEKELYNKINDFRKKLDTFMLTSLDIKEFISKNPEYASNSAIILKHSIIGNICSWKDYEIAYTYQEAIQASVCMD